MTIDEKLESLRNTMSRHNIDVYVVPTCDFHGSEYIGDYFKTREYISGFTGSAGTAVITMDEALLWTDGRYFLQAEKQLKGSGFVLMKEGEADVPTVIEYLKEKAAESEKTTLKNYNEKDRVVNESLQFDDGEEAGFVVAFDGRMISTSLAESISKIAKVNSDVDLIGEIWTDRPEISHNPIWELPMEYAGKSSDEKIADIREEMKKEECQVLVITSLDEIAWTLNLRGSDVDCNPVFMSFLVITDDGHRLFVQDKYKSIYGYLATLNNKKVWIDKETANYNIVKAINSTNTVINKFTPALHMKAVKNDTEIKNMKKAHLLDGIAMTKFIYWLKHNVGKVPMSEVSLGEKLKEFRGMAGKWLEKKNDSRNSYIGPSFEPIVGYKEHGAIVHYSATKESDYNVEPESMVLIDSGGQYMEGTTDITRTISLGPVTDKMRKMYTAVLKGHLNLMSAVFKEGCTGVSLDYLARKPLWEMGMDYNHGTGHGVGCLLNVHESPVGIRYRIMKNPELNPILKPGMITSNEPGVYLEGEFGIRIENLILCIEREKTPYGNFLAFESLTLVPYDKELIDRDDMTVEEQEMLNDYNKMVYEQISPYLNDAEREWLEQQ